MDRLNFEPFGDGKIACANFSTGIGLIIIDHANSFIGNYDVYLLKDGSPLFIDILKDHKLIGVPRIILSQVVSHADFDTLEDFNNFFKELFS